MKNKVYFCAGIGAIIIIQTTHFDFWSIYNIKPDLILLATCLVGLSRGSASGITFGFFVGLIQDAFSSGLFGAQSFSKAIWGYVSGRSVLKLDPRYPLVQLILISLFSLGDALLMHMLHSIFIDSAPLSKNRLFLFTVLGQTAYNLVLWPLIYHLGNTFFILQQEAKR
ncbi:MAG: rod shape-determining protein MreD [bacterium]